MAESPVIAAPAVDNRACMNEVFELASSMEEPLRVARDLIVGIDFMADSVTDAGPALATMSDLAEDQCKALEEMRAKVFRATQPIARQRATGCNEKTGDKQKAFDEALAEYVRLRKISDECTDDDPNVDKAVDDYGVAMDHLIDEVPAPNLSAVIVKWELAQACAEGTCGLVGNHEASIMADMRRLAGEA